MSKMYSLVALICIFSVIGVPSHGLELNLRSKTITVAITPFTNEGKLNLSMVSEVANFYLRNNLTTVLIMEFDGGGALLSLLDRIALVTEWMKYSKELTVMVEVGLQSFADTLKLARFCSYKNVSAITHFPEQAYKAVTVEEAIAELRSISEVAPNIPLIYNELLSTAPIVRTDAVYFAGDKVSTFRGVETSPDGNNNIEAGMPANNDTSQCKKEIWIYDIQNMYSAFCLGLRSVSLGPNLLPGIALAMEAAVDKCDKKMARKYRNRMNSVTAAVTILDGNTINTYTRSYFTNIKAGVELMTGMNFGARFFFEKANSTAYNKIASNLRSIGVRLADDVSQ